MQAVGHLGGTHAGRIKNRHFGCKVPDEIPRLVLTEIAGPENRIFELQPLCIFLPDTGCRRIPLNGQYIGSAPGQGKCEVPGTAVQVGNPPFDTGRLDHEVYQSPVQLPVGLKEPSGRQQNIQIMVRKRQRDQVRLMLVAGDPILRTCGNHQPAVGDATADPVQIFGQGFGHEQTVRHMNKPASGKLPEVGALIPHMHLGPVSVPPVLWRGDQREHLIELFRSLATKPAPHGLEQHIPFHGKTVFCGHDPEPTSAAPVRQWTGMLPAPGRGLQDTHRHCLNIPFGLLGHLHQNPFARQHTRLDHDHHTGFQTGQTAATPQEFFYLDFDVILFRHILRPKRRTRSPPVKNFVTEVYAARRFARQLTRRRRGAPRAPAA